jgi:hypothetical protein
VKFPIGGKVREPFREKQVEPVVIPVPTVKVWMEEDFILKLALFQF